MNPTYIIAEAGVNHDGDMARARDLIDIAVEAGADAVKFQLFDPTSLVTQTAPTADYQSRNLDDAAISQKDMLTKLALPPEAFAELAQYCASKKIDFLCTPFDAASLAYLVSHTSMPFLKLASGEVTNGPLLLDAARTGLPVILSTGMSDLAEIGIALSVLHHGYYGEADSLPRAIAQPTQAMLQALNGKVTMLHCVSQYPAPVSSMNLRAMDSMQRQFHLPVGLSDHSVGITMAIAAVARGAVMIEKHFTYDVNAHGPDHAASLTPEELTAMITAIRAVEVGLGNDVKQCVAAEATTQPVARRSVVAAQPITAGTVFSADNLICKRPATGPLPPNALWKLIGRAATHTYTTDAFIRAEELE